MEQYNKLVRDNIPEIIRKSNKIPITRELSSEEFAFELNRKLHEEFEEYVQTNSIEELADINEVVMAILQSRNITIAEFEIIRQNKKTERGGFSKRIFLEKVLEDGE